MDMPYNLQLYVRWWSSQFCMPAWGCDSGVIWCLINVTWPLWLVTVVQLINSMHFHTWQPSRSIWQLATGYKLSFLDLPWSRKNSISASMTHVLPNVDKKNPKRLRWQMNPSHYWFLTFPRNIKISIKIEPAATSPKGSYLVASVVFMQRFPAEFKNFMLKIQQIQHMKLRFCWCWDS